MLGKIMELKTTMEDYMNMLRCVFDVALVILDEKKKIFVDITSIDYRMDDVEGSSGVQVGEVKDIKHIFEDAERIQTSRHEEIQRTIIDIKRRKHE